MRLVPGGFRTITNARQTVFTWSKTHSRAKDPDRMCVVLPSDKADTLLHRDGGFAKIVREPLDTYQC